MPVDKVKGIPYIFLNGQFIQLAQNPDKINVVIAKLTQSHNAGIFLVGLKQSGTGGHVDAGLHLEIRQIIGFVEILFDILINAGYYRQLMLLPLLLLILVLK